jgi:hypothetical protein
MRASYVKKFAPVQAALLMFGKKASKSACVNHAPIPLPVEPGEVEGAGVGELVDALDAAEEVDAGTGVVVDSPDVAVQPSAFQIVSALQ